MINKRRFLGLLAIIAAIFVPNSSLWAETQQLSLSTGWNFISIQVEPDAPAIENVLSGLAVESVWYYDSLLAMNGMEPWVYYKADNPAFLNNLLTIHARKGYWFKMYSDDTLIINGKIPATSISCYPGINGETGWNAVGFFSPTDIYTVSEVFGEMTEDLNTVIWGYDSALNDFMALSSIDILEPGKAYWIEVSDGFELTPDIEVSPTLFNFGSQGEKGMIQLRSRLSDEIEWQATAYTDDGRNWLGIKENSDDSEEPVAQLSGSVNFYNKPIYIFINRSGLLPGDYTGQVRILSVDKPDFPVEISVSMTVEPIGGDYSGTLVIQEVDGKSISPLSTNIFASVYMNGIDVTAVISAGKSLIFPYDIILNGGITDTNTSFFSVAGALLLSSDDSLNPYADIGKYISRQITLETTLNGSGNNALGGIYRETIQGMIGRSIEVEGAFQMHKINEEPTVNGNDRSGTLTGTVMDVNTGQPINAAAVIITGAGIGKYSSTLGDGKFSFFVPDSDYVINIQAPGYESVQQYVSFNHSDFETLTIPLSPVIQGTITSDYNENTQLQDIPDAPSEGTPGDTLVSTLEIDTDDVIEDVTLFIDISHENVSELIITIVSPTGTSHTVYNCDSGDFWSNTFYIDEPFIGENSAGIWTIMITDNNPENEGVLNAWSLTLNLMEDADSIAAFNTNIVSGRAPLTVQFNALSDDAYDWVWDFGDQYDSSPGSGKQSIHTYSQPGTYTVSLTATGPDGSGEVTKPALIQVGMAFGPGNDDFSFKWTALPLQTGVDIDQPPTVSNSDKNMTVLIGAPVTGGKASEGYTCRTRRGDKVMWSGALPIK